MPVRESGQEPRTETEDRTQGVRALQAAAKISGGRYFRAQDSAALLSACRDIDRLERREIKSFQYRRYYEGYPWFGLAAFVFFVSVYMLELTMWRRTP